MAAIHALGVVHGDIRAQNILVAEGGSRVWIIDFEMSSILGDRADAVAQIQSEIDQVKYLFKKVKEGPSWTGNCATKQGQAPVVPGSEIVSV